MSDCILWTKSKDRGGYGQVKHRGKVVRAHRLAYCQHHGLAIEAIADKHVRHKCNNRACVNVDHLDIGEAADNMRDKAEFGNNRMKIDQSSIDSMRAEYEAGATQPALAKKYGCNQSHVSRVVRGLDRKYRRAE